MTTNIAASKWRLSCHNQLIQFNYINIIPFLYNHNHKQCKFHISIRHNSDERYTEPKPWSNPFQQRNQVDTDTPATKQSIQQSIVSKYNILNPRGRQPLSVALEQDAQSLNEQRIKTFNAINDRAYTESDDINIRREESDNQSIIDIINKNTNIQSKLVDSRVPNKHEQLRSSTLMPRNRHTADHYTQLNKLGCVTELQLARLCILYKYNSNVFSIDRLADMFHVDADKLKIILKYISIPYIYTDIHRTYAADHVNITRNDIDEIKVAGVDSVLDNELIQLINGVEMSNPRSIDHTLPLNTQSHSVT